MTDRSEESEQLHLASLMALEGLSKSPERDLAALLRSDFDIDPIIRTKIADALEDKAQFDGISLAAKGKNRSPASKQMRAMKLRIRNVRAGREVMRLQSEGISYADAIEAVAKENGLGKKTVEQGITLAREADAWIEQRLPSWKSSLGENIDRYILEGMFCFADADNQGPSETDNSP